MAAALGAAVVLSVPDPAAAQTNGCPAFDRPSVRVDFQMAPLGRDDTRSTTELTRMPGRAPGPAGAAGGNVLGLAHAKYGVDWKSRMTFVQTRDGSVCAALKTIDVVFSIAERIVFVASELPRGTCIHGEVLAHEMKHVATDEALLREFGAVLRQRVENIATRQGPVRARSMEQADHALRRPVQATVNELSRMFTRERDRRQAKVDTIAEYKRVSASCGGELSRYIKGKTTL